MTKSSSLTKSRRSGGPKSDEGKKAVSSNALKTGAYSSLIILPGEDEVQFQELEAQFILDFEPRDIAESAIVQELASITWKKIRLEKLEQSSFLRKMNLPLDEYDFKPYGLKFDEAAFILFKNEVVMTELDAKAIKYELEYALPLKNQDLTVEQYAEMKAKCADLYDSIVKHARACSLFIDEDPVPEDLASATIELSYGEVSLSRYAIEQIIPHLKSILWYCDNAQRIKEAVQRIKEHRLLELMQIDKTRRIHDDLSRTFFRALSELRKHQEWRRKMQIVDIPEQEGQA
jgi:hypothetical protein